jgi:hypothetical protein
MSISPIRPPPAGWLGFYIVARRAVNAGLLNHSTAIRNGAATRSGA